jgi:signal transduction histidine kinase
MRTMTGALANPRLQRWLPVIVLPPILLLDGLLSVKGDDVDLLSVVFAVIATLPLALRERLGFLAMAPLLVGGVVLVLWDFEPGTTVVAIPAWALFDLARHYGRRETIVAAVLVGPCVLVSVLPFADGGSELASVTLLNLAWCEFALAAGYVMWHNRALVEREVAAREAAAERRLGDERLRMAREVHDVVAHAMVAINVQAGVAAHLLDDDTDQAREALLHIKRTSGDALSDLRATLGILRDPDQAAPVGPAAGLEDLDDVAAQLRAAGVDVMVDVAAAGPVPTPVHSASYRIVQEALTNVLRHAADARTVRVVARSDEDMLTLVVEDDGGGAVASAAPDGAGAGVRGMRERAEALGGMLSAGPSGEHGWRVEAALPLIPVKAGP